jgi:hypothetical protein
MFRLVLFFLSLCYINTNLTFLETSRCVTHNCSCVKETDLNSSSPYTCSTGENDCYSSLNCVGDRNGICSFTERHSILKCLIKARKVATHGITTMSGNDNVQLEGRILSTDCVIKGCSDEVCQSVNDPDPTTCDYQAKFICYKTAMCEVQADGMCGWSINSLIFKCLSRYP